MQAVMQGSGVISGDTGGDPMWECWGWIELAQGQSCRASVYIPFEPNHARVRL
jgi:hypothetical protein